MILALVRTKKSCFSLHRKKGFTIRWGSFSSFKTTTWLTRHWCALTVPLKVLQQYCSIFTLDNCRVIAVNVRAHSTWNRYTTLNFARTSRHWKFGFCSSQWFSNWSLIHGRMSFTNLILNEICEFTVISTIISELYLHTRTTFDRCIKIFH